MKIYFKCGCGQYNFCFNDWICHFKSQGFKRGLYLLLKTKIQFKRDF